MSSASILFALTERELSRAFPRQKSKLRDPFTGEVSEVDDLTVDWAAIDAVDDRVESSAFSELIPSSEPVLEGHGFAVWRMERSTVLDLAPACVSLAEGRAAIVTLVESADAVTGRSIYLFCELT